MDLFITRRGSGNNLNFTVVDGTTQPENPKENTIWVNTPNEITGWSFSAVEPTEPIEGAVWFEIGAYNSVGVNILDENEAFVYPRNAKQYVNGSWTIVPAKTYSNAQWLEWFTYLINGNDLCTGISGGWTKSGLKYSQYGCTAEAPTITVSDNTTKITETSSRDGIARTTKKIDLTNYKTLVFRGDCTIGVDGYGLTLRVWSSIGTYQSTNEVAGKSFDYNAVDVEHRLSVESLSGSYYVGFGFYSGGNVVVKSLYLE